MDFYIALIISGIMFLGVMYKSKKDKGFAVKIGYVITGMLFFVLLSFGVYQEGAAKNNLYGAAIIILILIGMFVVEGLEVLGKIPDLTGKTIGEKT